MIVNVSFFIDIVFIFRTAIFNSDMEVITDTKQIAVAYLKGMFWIDFLSTVPLDAMLILLIDKEKAQNFKLMALLKLFRIVRLQKIISSLNTEINKKVMLKILKLLLYLTMYIHCQACLWFYIVK